jgi:prephenate dehydrogenase
MSQLPGTVTIFGTGLIGGSLALALRRAKPDIRIGGIDKPHVLARAQELGIINADVADNPDLVVLATPVGDILALLDEIPANTRLVTDVGSTKVAICRKAAQLGLSFVGSHPMAGMELSGPEAANPNLFQDAPFFLCPVGAAAVDGLGTMTEIARAMGAVPQVINPDDHDRLVAQISHLPQVISTILAEHTAANKHLAGPGLRSMTRLAGSPFEVWRDIFKTSGFLPQELQLFINKLQSVLDSVTAGEFDEIEKLFKRGGPE